MGFILMGALALTAFVAFGALFMLWNFVCWAGPRIVQGPEMVRGWVEGWKARRISRAVDQAAERERDEEQAVEMLGKAEGEGRMSGETLRGGEERGVGK